MQTMQKMPSSRSASKQKGFTIIELVVVILLLGILAATALPRFMDVTDQAHQAAVQGVQGGLATSVVLFRAQWFGEGQPNTAPTGFGLGNVLPNTNGYPSSVVGEAEFGSQICVDLWGALLQSGRPLIASIDTPITEVLDGTNIEGFEFGTIDGPLVGTVAETVSWVAAMNLAGPNPGTVYLDALVDVEDPLDPGNTDPDLIEAALAAIDLENDDFYSDGVGGTEETGINLGACDFYYVGQYKQPGPDFPIPVLTYNFSNGEISRGLAFE
jgi:MSHA pilin protein MshB